MCYGKAGKIQEAIGLQREVLAFREESLGPDHPKTLMTLNNLAYSLGLAGNKTGAQELYEKLVNRYRNALGEDHRNTTNAMSKLGQSYWTDKQFEPAIKLFEEVLAIKSRNLGRDHLETQMAIVMLGIVYKDAGQTHKAIPLLEETYQNSENYPSLNTYVGHLRQAYLQSNRVPELIGLVKEMVTRARDSSDSEQLDIELRQGGEDLMNVGSYEAAEKLLAEYLRRMKAACASKWREFHAQSLLGAAFLEQSKFGDAAPLLQGGYEGLTEQAEFMPSEDRKKLLVSALERLIELAKSTENDEDLKKWQAELKSLQDEDSNEPSAPIGVNPVGIPQIAKVDFSNC